jgi:hypothetical protein
MTSRISSSGLIVERRFYADSAALTASWVNLDNAGAIFGKKEWSKGLYHGKSYAL